jgi:hypothetical protein
VAIKLKNSNGRYLDLKKEENEQEMIKKLHGEKGIPKITWIGKQGN